MEIERKFLVRTLPEHLDSYPNTDIEQAYLCIHPVVRVRRDGDAFYLTYKGSGMLMREEYNLPLDEASYYHLRQKADGTIITKTRYRIPLDGGLTAELDIFSGALDGLMLVEVEFPTKEAAQSYISPPWFGKDVTMDPRYHNSNMSRGMTP